MKRQTSRRVRWPLVLGIGAALVVIGAAAAIASRDTSPPVATVNGAPITQDALKERSVFDSFLQANTQTSLPANREVFIRGLLDRMIEEELIRQKARDMGIAATQAEIDAQIGEMFSEDGAAGLDRIASMTSDATGLPDARARLLWLQQVEGIVLTNKLIDAQHYPVDETVTVGHVYHILVASEEEAQIVLARLARGEEFQALAAELSLDEDTKFRGGDLGVMSEQQMGAGLPPEVLAEGVEEYGMIQTPAGWHVFTVADRREEPASAEQRRVLAEDMFQQTLDEWRAGADIQIDQDVLARLLER